MKLYNSLSREVDDFEPINKDMVRIYTCGPTVYNYVHIGNLRCYIMEDILVKTLKYLGYNVKRVMNITDVGHLTNDSDDGEDKMLKGAKREHKTVQEIAQYYTDAFMKDFFAVNNEKPDIIEPATNCIDEYIKIISVLLEKEYAYIAGENIYFDTSKLQSYHKFFNFKQEDLEIGVRDGVDLDTNKRNPNDFVLWFTKSKFENQALKWDSPWGVGYPGWHIECSAIAMKHLGENVDIHCGGMGNVFPHHTNEIAQSEAYLGHKWCNFWMHVQHLHLATGKMSKSKGEFITIDVLKEKGFTPIEYRFFCLQSHYRNQLLFSYEIMENSANAYRKLKAKVLSLKNDGAVETDAFNSYNTEFKDCIADDLNIAKSFSVVFAVLKDESINDATKIELISEFDKVLSLDLFKKEEKVVSITEDEILEKINQRIIAKQNRDFALADSIRDELLSKGVKLIDTKEGTKFEIV